MDLNRCNRYLNWNSISCALAIL